jgi:acetoin utilization protein AcuB
MSNEPTVAQFMTSEPATADEGLLLTDAQERMLMDNIRHLVVRNGNTVSGMLSSRDIAVALSLPGIDTKKLTVADAMSPCPFVCGPHAKLSAVAHEMEAHRYGAAIVAEDDEVVGVFTTTDALRALREIVTGQPAEPAVKPTHLPPETPAHARPYRLRRHSPIDSHTSQMFATSPSR